MGRTDHAERFIAASPDRLFACWADPERLIRWLPPHGMAGRVACFDLRPGQSFRIVLSYTDPAIAGKTGGGEDAITGRFVAVAPPHHLAFVSRFEGPDPAFQGAMRMDWYFDSAPPGTLVRIVAQDVPPGVRAEDHADGMGATLAQLAAFVA